uniref:Uncharacterized protein n=1 Tax=Romanomermis culicivorax TaxID=13658 RepID=A0A915IU53_ROMCU
MYKIYDQGFRHGYRNPAQFFKNDTSRETAGWGWEGASQLTNIGKQQAYSLGKFLRNRYAKLLPTEFQPSELLRMYNVKCPAYTEAYQPISDDNLPQSRDWLKNEDQLVKYIMSNTGLNGSLSDLADVADNIQSILYTPGAKLPGWIENPSLAGFNKDKILKEILEYAEAHQIQCAVDRPCAKAMAGLWLDEILKILKQKESGKLADRKAHFYAAHTETVLSLMKLLGMDVAETPTSAGFVLEFRQQSGGGKGQVRALFHEPNHQRHTVREAHVVRLPYCSSGEWCSLDSIAQAASKESFADWQTFCRLPKCAI